MTVLGEAVATKFGKKYAASRKPLARFLEMVRAAEWRHLPDLKKSFSDADYAP